VLAGQVRYCSAELVGLQDRGPTTFRTVRLTGGAAAPEISPMVVPRRTVHRQRPKEASIERKVVYDAS
jgi:hypothetical protein